MTAENDACPNCGGREWSTGSDGLADVASVAAVCLPCGYLTTSTVSLRREIERLADSFERQAYEEWDGEELAAIMREALEKTRPIPPGTSEETR